MGMGRISIPHAPIQKENKPMNNKPVAWINEDNFLLGDILNSAVYRTKPNDESTIPLYTREQIELLRQSNARLSIELSIINRMIDGEELDPIDMEYYGTLHEKVAKLLSR